MSIPTEVTQFVADHPSVVKMLRFPERDCPECHRTMVPVAIFMVEDEPPILHLKCSLHRTNDYATVLDDDYPTLDTG